MSIVGFVLIVLVSTSCFGIDYKRLSGPPQSFEKHRIPSALNGAMHSSAAVVPLTLGSTKSFSEVFAVDGSELSLAFYSSLAPQYDVSLVQPNGVVVPNLPSFSYDASYTLTDSGNVSVPAVGWTFSSPIKGNWTFQLARKSSFVTLPREPVHDIMPDAFLVIRNEAPQRIFSHLSSYFLEKDALVGCVSQMTSASSVAAVGRGVRPQVLKSARIEHAELDVMFPDGKTRMRFPMYDDGLHSDLQANDGIYGGDFNATQQGTYKATAVLRGQLEDGTPFLRSVSHLMSVVNDDVSFTRHDATITTEKGKEQLKIRVPVTGSSPAGTLYRTYAEVYAHTLAPKPVAWIGGYTEKACTNSGSCYVDLELNARWMKDVDATKGLSLRNVYISDHLSNIPLAEKNHIKVRGNLAAIARLVKSLSPVTQPTEEMLMGVRPAHLRPEAVAARKAVATNETLPNLVLVHGYCAQLQPWTSTKFTNAFVFEDLDQNRRITEFAELVASKTAHLPSFGIIGHSQGGLVSTHIHNYMWTGLAASTGARKVQSVGSPYLGCSGAGTGADLIKIFGLGCGSNFDLSTDGAALWQSGIQTEARKDVFYYLTKWKQAGLIKYCKLATNLVLQWPNDGLTEVDLGHLDGGNFVELAEGECHTVDMNYPPQYRNDARNAIMNDLAAR